MQSAAKKVRASPSAVAAAAAAATPTMGTSTILPRAAAEAAARIVIAAPEMSGPVACLMHTVRHEGWRALYKGMLSPLSMMGVITAVEMGSWGAFKKALHSARGLGEGERRTKACLLA